MERLLISTFNQLILWDGKQNVIRKGHDHKGRHKYYGLTWDDEGRIYVMEGGRIPTEAIFHVFDGTLRHRGKLPIGRGISDPHQCYWWDGTLYIANTAFNRISAWDGQNVQHISGGIWGKRHEHINSIWCDGQQFFVIEHRKKETPKRIRIFDLNFGLLDTVELYQGRAIASGIHNVYVENGLMYLCGPGELLRVCLEDGEIDTFCPAPIAGESNYLRGLARTPDHFFVGVSEAAVRDKRIKGDSAVLVLDNDLKLVDTILLEGTGNLTEIRAIDGPDLAHNRIECPYQ